MSGTNEPTLKTPYIRLKEVSASYESTVALEKVNLEISSSDFIGVIGPNGGGKTSLLKLILGIMRPSSGIIERNLTKEQIGYLPQISQFDKQFPITVQDVVRSGISRSGRRGRVPKRAENEWITSSLETVGMSELAQRPIGSLSGGELQRTMLARAIISDPKLLVLDEPNTYVDNRFEQELYELLVSLNDRMAIMLVSHDVGTVSSYVKTIACVNRNLHYHPSNQITNEQLAVYNCPIELVAHGPVPHRVIETHKH